MVVERLSVCSDRECRKYRAASWQLSLATQALEVIACES
jgi:hypothetical protein